LAYLGGKLQAFAKSYITLYNDKIEGLVISGSKNVVSINYADIQSLRISENQNRELFVINMVNLHFRHMNVHVKLLI